MRHKLATRVMLDHAQLLRVRACIVCGESLPQRLADLTTQADVDACKGLDSVYRMHTGVCIRPETRD